MSSDRPLLLLYLRLAAAKSLEVGLQLASQLPPVLSNNYGMLLHLTILAPGEAVRQVDPPIHRLQIILVRVSARRATVPRETSLYITKITSSAMVRTIIAELSPRTKISALALEMTAKNVTQVLVSSEEGMFSFSLSKLSLIA